MEYSIAKNAEGTATERVPNVPGCVVIAPTVEEAVRRTSAAIVLHLEAASQRSKPLPPPKALDNHKKAGTFGENVQWDIVEVGSATRLRPRDFMRARRPELYSDSATEREPVADIAFLDFTLARITERNDEVPFEHSCRKLAEKEICPNSIDRDGTHAGFGIELTAMIFDSVNVPVIASGGAGTTRHVADVLKTDASAAIVSSMLYSPRLPRNFSCSEIKRFLVKEGIHVRPDFDVDPAWT